MNATADEILARVMNPKTVLPLYHALAGLEGIEQGLRLDFVGFEKSADRIAAALTSIRKAVSETEQALSECEDYFDQRADADCVGDPLEFVGNEEMKLLTVVRDALKALGRAK